MSTKDHYRQLQPGERLPDGEPRRYNIHGAWMLRWRVAPHQYVQVLERYVEDGKVIGSGRRTISKRDLLAAVTPDSSMQAVADRLGVARSVVRRELARHKIEWQPRPGGTKQATTADQDAAIIAVYTAHGPTVAGEWANLHPTVVRRRVAATAGTPRRHSWRKAPDNCGACPRCIDRPRPALTVVPESDPVDADDLFEREAAKYQRRAARRLELAVDRARTHPAPTLLGLDPRDSAWRDLAACKGLDPAIFYPTDSTGRPGNTPDGMEIPRLICGSCPVRDSCRPAVLDLPGLQQEGVWGGVYTTRHNNRELRREQAA